MGLVSQVVTIPHRSDAKKSVAKIPGLMGCGGWRIGWRLAHQTQTLRSTRSIPETAVTMEISHIVAGSSKEPHGSGT